MRTEWHERLISTVSTPSFSATDGKELMISSMSSLVWFAHTDDRRFRYMPSYPRVSVRAPATFSSRTISRPSLAQRPLFTSPARDNAFAATTTVFSLASALREKSASSIAPPWDRTEDSRQNSR